MREPETSEEVLIYPSKETAKRSKEEVMLLPEAISKLVEPTDIASSLVEASDLAVGSPIDPSPLLDEPVCSLGDSLRSNLLAEALVHSAKVIKVEVTTVLNTVS